MKTKELKLLSIEDLNKKLISTIEEYLKLKIEHKISNLENPIQIRSLRREIAQIKTFIKQLI